MLGIDMESVNHPQAQYGYLANLKSLAGSCSAVPLADDLIEVVTSFETIQYHDQHEEMIQEIKSFSGDVDSFFNFASCFPPPMYFVAVGSNHKEFLSANLESMYLDTSNEFDKT